MTFEFINDLQAFLKRSAGGDFEIVPEICPPEMTGDVTINCFRFAKPLRRNPVELAIAVRDHLLDNDDVSAAECIKAFVNVTLKNDTLFRATVADEEALMQQALLPAAERQRMLVEYSAPNTNKPQHLGHVRNNSLGMAVTAMLRRVGHDVVPVNLVNDRGIHICKSMIAYERFGADCSPASTGKKGDHLVGDFYVKFDEEYRRQVEELKAADPTAADQSAESLFLKTEIGRCAQQMLQAWENDDPKVHALWQKLNGWVLQGFDETYARMGAEFQHVYYESDTYTSGRDIIRDGLEKEIFFHRDDGATAIDLSEFKLDTKVVLRSDGTSVYVTQDIGTTVLKHRDFRPDVMVWIVGDEQIFHFKVLFAILRRLGYSWAENLHHLVYGMVNLPSGRMKSREGTVVDADDLFDEMVRLARQATLERCDGDVPDDLEKRARAIGMGAVKFMLLKVNAKTTITFDPDASIKFEGDTGPYVQYACARIASMLRKQGEHDLAAAADWSLLGEPDERTVAIRCATYGDVLKKAAHDWDTSRLANYLLDLTKEFSRFYKNHSVLSAATPELRRTRLELCRRVRRILADGLNTLTIDAPEAM